MGIFDFLFGRKNKDEYEKYYNFETGKVEYIHINKLKPPMMKAKMEGIEGTIWINPEQVQQSEYMHPPFSNDVKELFKELKLKLDEVYHRTIEEWEDGFRRDKNPEQEIAIWFYLAQLYQQFTTNQILSIEEKQDYFKVLLACTYSPKETVLNIVTLNALPREKALQAIDAFFKPNN